MLDRDNGKMYAYEISQTMSEIDRLVCRTLVINERQRYEYSDSVVGSIDDIYRAAATIN